MTDNLATVEETAAHYGVLVGTVYNWISRKRFIGPHFFKGGDRQWYVNRAFFIDYSNEKQPRKEKSVRVSFTKAQYEQMILEAGGVPLATWIRSKLCH